MDLKDKIIAFQTLCVLVCVSCVIVTTNEVRNLRRENAQLIEVKDAAMRPADQIDAASAKRQGRGL